MRVRELKAKRRWCAQKEGIRKRLSGDNPEENRGRGERDSLTPQSWTRDREERAVARSLRPVERRDYSADKLENPESSSLGKMHPGAGPEKNFEKASEGAAHKW